MGGIMSKWLVLQEYPVTGGTVSDEAVERWVAAARQAYLAQCPVLHETARAAEVVVTATASEVRPRSFTIAVRLRPVGGDRETPLNASCVIRLEDEATGEARELGTAVRDERVGIGSHTGSITRYSAARAAAGTVA
jgi:hypothetical protein